ncbi:MAG: PspC domain-containing protein [Flavipsychrobacter sp.]
MQRIIQITIAGRMIPIEEDAYLILRDYLKSLERQFANEEGQEEIIQDIEYRIAELFAIRLQANATAIDQQDVQKVMETLGHASDLNDSTSSNKRDGYVPGPYTPPTKQTYTDTHYNANRRLYRNPYDKILGGVCSGIASYFDIDPTIVRLIFALLLFGAGIGFVAYIVAWIVIPIARTPEELRTMQGGEAMDFHTMTGNMATELQDLKRRAEQMSRELKDFFSKNKK